jgi:hypothetical protein
MFIPNGEPPAYAIARLVCLYKTRGLTIYEWNTHKITQGTIIRFINHDLMKIRASLTIARDASRYMSATLPSAGAAAYIIMDSGHEPSIAHRFLAPHGETLNLGDPRISLARIMRLYAGARDDHPDWECLAYMLRAWNLYNAKRRVAHVTWKPDDGIPRVSNSHSRAAR